MEEFRRNSSNSAAFTTNRMELRRSIKKVVAPILLKLVYIFPDEATQTLHLITLGDKSSQKADLKECAAFIRDLRKGQ